MVEVEGMRSISINPISTMCISLFLLLVLLRLDQIIVYFPFDFTDDAFISIHFTTALTYVDVYLFNKIYWVG